VRRTNASYTVFYSYIMGILPIYLVIIGSRPNTNIQYNESMLPVLAFRIITAPAGCMADLGVENDKETNAEFFFFSAAFVKFFRGKLWALIMRTFLVILTIRTRCHKNL